MDKKMTRTEYVDTMYKNIVDMLPNINKQNPNKDEKELLFWTNDDGEILSTEPREIDTLEDLFDQLYENGVVQTGYYDDSKDLAGVCAGLHYMKIA